MTRYTLVCRLFVIREIRTREWVIYLGIHVRTGSTRGPGPRPRPRSRALIDLGRSALHNLSEAATEAGAEDAGTVRCRTKCSDAGRKLISLGNFLSIINSEDLSRGKKYVGDYSSRFRGGGDARPDLRPPEDITDPRLSDWSAIKILAPQRASPGRKNRGESGNRNVSRRCGG